MKTRLRNGSAFDHKTGTKSTRKYQKYGRDPSRSGRTLYAYSGFSGFKSRPEHHLARSRGKRHEYLFRRRSKGSRLKRFSRIHDTRSKQRTVGVTRSPQMKTCTFCGNPGGSLEHIIAQCLIKRMQAQDFPVQLRHFKDGEGATERPPHRLKNYATRSVCAKCNNDWMGSLDASLERTFGPLIEPTWPKMGSRILKEALREHEALTRWALKTAITASLNSTMENVIDEHTPKALFAGRIPNRVQVDLGYISDANVGVAMFKGFWWRGNDVPQWLSHKLNQSFHVVFQLNHLAVRVFRIANARPVFWQQRGMLPLQCYPVTQDPELRDFAFRDLEDFTRSLELTFEEGPGGQYSTWRFQ